MVAENQETLNDTGHAARRSKASLLRPDYYQDRVPEGFEVIYGQLDSKSPDISKVKNASDQEFYRLKRIASGHGGGSLQEKVDAANYVYDEIMRKRPDFIGKALDHITSQIDLHKIQTVHIPLQVKEAIYDAKTEEAKKKHTELNVNELDTNALALITSLRMADDLQALAEKKGYTNLSFSHDPPLVKKSVSIDWRGSADIIGHFVAQPKYDVSHFHENDLVFIANDSVQTGGVSSAIITALKRRDCHVLGIASLTCLPESTRLIASPQVRGGFSQAFRLCYGAKHPGERYTREDERSYRANMGHALHQVGLSIDSLTNREVLMVMSLMLDRNNAEHVEFFNRMKKLAGVDPGIIEGNDALVLSDGVMTPKQFGEQIRHRIHEITQKGMFGGKSAALTDGRGR